MSSDNEWKALSLDEQTQMMTKALQGEQTDRQFDFDDEDRQQLQKCQSFWPQASAQMLGLNVACLGAFAYFRGANPARLVPAVAYTTMALVPFYMYQYSESAHLNLAMRRHLQAKYL